MDKHWNKNDVFLVSSVMMMMSLPVTSCLERSDIVNSDMMDCYREMWKEEGKRNRAEEPCRCCMI